MKIHRYFAFQERAIAELHRKAFAAQKVYQVIHDPQIVSFTAPTGAGKTIMAATFIENVFWGTLEFPERQDAIFIWLSDSPELNQQSKDKIDILSDKIKMWRTETIKEESFDKEMLDDGHIYFLNTQKLGKNSNLTIHSDSRQYTIWETLANTIREKGDRLFVIIDEAHRGAKGDKEIARATTIMQKFIKGSAEDGLKPMPVVIGMSATVARFDALVGNLSRTIHKVVVTPEEVRSSGLLKDHIIINYPENNSQSDMAVMEVAAENWKMMWSHWDTFCQKYHHAVINPILLIQVESSHSADVYSDTNLDLCLESIERRTGWQFGQGEVVHTFGQTTSAIDINGLQVNYCEPSRIADDKKIKVVFFKENLSTGWDCPRAETMMSFRHATDATYIAQLLGRMVRTPAQSRITSDELLNDVSLYLPYFDRSTVKVVVDALQNIEGGVLPTEIISGTIGGGEIVILSSDTPIKRRKKPETNGNAPSGAGQLDLFGEPESEVKPAEDNSDQEDNTTIEESSYGNQPEQQQDNCSEETTQTQTPIQQNGIEPAKQKIEDKNESDEISRRDIIKAINDKGLTTWFIRSVKINDYLKSMFSLARFVKNYNLDKDVYGSIKDDIVKMIAQYATQLKQSGEYEQKKNDVLSFTLHSQVFDVFGNAPDKVKELTQLSITDTVLDSQFSQADKDLGSEGVANLYGSKHLDPSNPIEFKVDVILFTLDDDCKKKLNKYAKDKFYKLIDEHRLKVAKLNNDKAKTLFSSIIKDGSENGETNYTLPLTTTIKKAMTSESGEEYADHLYVDDSSKVARISLNNWEKAVINEERKRDDFVCWLRNPSRGNDALAIKYTHNGEVKPFYPDFIVIRDVDGDYIVDILEPHNPAFDDNVGKAKGLAEYVKKHNTVIGRAQMIRENGGRYVRLDVCKSQIQNEVLKIQNAEELNHLFDKYGEVESLV